MTQNFLLHIYLVFFWYLGPILRNLLECFCLTVNNMGVDMTNFMKRSFLGFEKEAFRISQIVIHISIEPL